MNKTTLILVAALACGAVAAQAAGASKRAPSKGEQPVIEETAADMAAIKVVPPQTPTRTAANGFTVVDKPYDAPLPITPVGAGAGRGAASGFPVKPAVQQSFKVEAGDGTLSRALRRWGREAKYPVIWEASRDLPAVAAVYLGDFSTAINQVMEDSGTGGYPLHACLHDNVVRILHTSQSCIR